MANESLAPPEPLQVPALVAPPGVSYNLENPNNTLHTAFVFTLAICFGVSTLATAMRLYTRVYVIKLRGLEDLLCFICWFMFIGYAITTSFVVSHGAGVHQWDVTLNQAMKVFFFTYLSELIYGIILMLLKTSILLQYRRVFTPAKKSDLIFWGTHGLSAIIILYYIAITFAVAFQCSPIKKAWDFLIPEGHCLSGENINISSGYFNTLTDFAILLLPQKVIWNLQMPVRRKAVVSGIFLVGLFASISSILRLIYSYKVSSSGDITYYICIMGLWTYAEIASCIICACLPVFPRFYQEAIQHWKMSSGSWSLMGTRIRTPVVGSADSAKAASEGQSSRASTDYELGEHRYMQRERDPKVSPWPEPGEVFAAGRE